MSWATPSHDTAISASPPGRCGRVVALPHPVRVVEQDSISHLLDVGTMLICGGGGGAPVTADRDGRLTRVKAVVDEDYVAAMLGVATEANRLLVPTDVSAVMRDFGTAEATTIPRLGLDELTAMQFPAGSMKPKIEACRRFVTAPGRAATTITRGARHRQIA